MKTERNKMKIKTLVIFIVSIQLAFSQSKSEYLKNNRLDLLNSNFEFPQSNFKIIGFGAYHGSQETENAENILLQKLIQNKKIKYYLPETDFGIAYYFNQYLKSGDTILLRDLVKHYGNRVPQEKSIETYNKWKKIKEINDNQLAKDKIEVVGVDFIVTYKYTSKLLIELFQTEKGKYESYDNLVSMVKIDTTDYSPNYDSYSKNILKIFLADYENNKPYFQTISKNKNITNNLIENINLTFKKLDREKTIYDNYLFLNHLYDFKSNPQFVRMGFFHIEKDRENNNPSFFTRLIENNIYKKEEIVSIAGFLTKSRVLWDIKYDENKKYIGYTTEGGYGIGDYWKEYFKGINKLKNNRLSKLTLYRLNNENSPYKKNQTDLMEIKLFLKKSNKNDLKGKTTTDYFDYAILISNSKANKPIEELDK
ncbi:hypothetical protein B0A77_14095 [Flavobacterium branchiophilum]|uniref:Uncharacterized protein n=2 Tax=Flavobacterium branchiophilum TaxID=55197 RepID=A0A2H3K8N2_9FLAO|nr:hypothetical protein B0A77_14095 [Flavobacterium branchiophilum]